MTDDFPSELDPLTAFLDAQPGPVQQAFQYCVALLMVEAGKARMIRVSPSEAGPLCTFETIAGDVFRLSRPPMSEVQELTLKAQLREILNEEDL